MSKRTKRAKRPKRSRSAGGSTRAMAPAALAATKNEDLEALHAKLIDLVDSISDAIVDETDIDKVRAMTREVEEINHRVNVVGGLLFARQVKEISDKMGDVDKAQANLQKAIQRAKSATQIVQTTTAFLTVVDQVIDVAKSFI